MKIFNVPGIGVGVNTSISKGMRSSSILILVISFVKIPGICFDPYQYLYQYGMDTEQQKYRYDSAAWHQHENLPKSYKLTIIDGFSFLFNLYAIRPFKHKTMRRS